MSRLNRFSIFVLLLWFSLGALADPAVAQDSDSRDWNQRSDTMKGALGLHYGKIGGQGLAFSYPLHWYLYLQGAGGVWHGAQDKRHNLGLSLRYILRQDAKLRLYLTAGTGFFYHKEKISDTAWNVRENWNQGAGVGIEFLQGQRWSWQADLAFVHEGEDDDIKLSPQLGFFFYW